MRAAMPAPEPVPIRPPPPAIGPEIRSASALGQIPSMSYPPMAVSIPGPMPPMQPMVAAYPPRTSLAPPPPILPPAFAPSAPLVGYGLSSMPSAPTVMPPPPPTPSMSNLEPGNNDGNEAALKKQKLDPYASKSKLFYSHF